MTIIPATQSLTARAIDAVYAARPAELPSATLRCSSLGNPCDRALWYAMRWAHPAERHEPRILRIFDNGHAREVVIVSMLRAAGMAVEDRDPQRGGQWRVEMAGGVLVGHVDGVVTGVPDAPKTPHLLEIKTMNDARWKAWRRKGVKDSDPKYWVQAQLYMHGLGLKRCLFVAENQNTREIEAERIEYAAEAALSLVARAERIAAADRPPQRMNDDPGWWQCKMCPALAICHQGVLAERNCRTCFAFVAGRCDRFAKPLSVDQQRAGCDHHVFNPVLVPAEMIDSDGDAGTITYRFADGSTFVDGMREVTA
jgi:hypothetical protein